MGNSSNTGTCYVELSDVAPERAVQHGRKRIQGRDGTFLITACKREYCTANDQGAQNHGQGLLHKRIQPVLDFTEELRATDIFKIHHAANIS